MVTKIDYSNIDAMRELFIGKTVRKITEDMMELSDGTIIKVVPNDGGCSCGAGDYELTYLNDCPDNAIMNVWVTDGGDDAGITSDKYGIFVLATDEILRKIAEFEGDDGSGYYGTGFWIEVM